MKVYKNTPKDMVNGNFYCTFVVGFRPKISISSSISNEIFDGNY
jgi:hypothetical protein